MEEFLRLENIHKSFVGVYALKGVDFSINKGEVHCLVGENGSGKSTLIKIMSGVLHPDRGDVSVEGVRIQHLASAQTIRRGIQVIYQDLSLFSNLTVAENIAFSQLIEFGRSMVRWSEIHAIAQAATDRIKVALDLNERVADLPIGLQQMVAICRALTSDVRLLILDEPTASLTKSEIDNLFSVVRDLQAHGIAILFVSHKLNEILDVAERVTVLRDGVTVGTVPRDELTNEKLISLMTGKIITQTQFTYARTGNTELLRVRGLSKQHNFRDISFDLHEGEIVGITGLIGSGRTELALALFGESPADSGTIAIQGKPVRIRSVRDAVRAGIAYVPENRLVQGLIMKLSVGDNIVAAIITRILTRLRLIQTRRKADTISEWIEKLGIKVSEPGVAVQTLSGGNQQRVVIAKWLATNPKILILDGPTVGIDVAAKFSIHEIIRDLARQGLGVILISDEVSEVVNNCNRILLMKSGTIDTELDSSDVDEDRVQELIESM